MGTDDSTEYAKNDMLLQTYIMIDKLISKAQQLMVSNKYQWTSILTAFDCIREIYRHVRPLINEKERNKYDDKKEKLLIKIEKFQEKIQRNVISNPNFNVENFINRNKEYRDILIEVDLFFDEIMVLKQECGLGIPTYYKRSREEYLKHHMGVQ